MQRIDWLPDELQGALDPRLIIDFLRFFPNRVVHPKQKKYALVEWGKARNVKITSEMLQELEKEEEV